MKPPRELSLPMHFFIRVVGGMLTCSNLAHMLTSANVMQYTCDRLFYSHQLQKHRALHQLQRKVTFREAQLCRQLVSRIQLGGEYRCTRSVAAALTPVVASWLPASVAYPYNHGSLAGLPAGQSSCKVIVHVCCLQKCLRRQSL